MSALRMSVRGQIKPSPFSCNNFISEDTVLDNILAVAYYRPKPALCPRQAAET